MTNQIKQGDQHRRMAEQAKLYDRLDSYISESRNEFENKLAEIVEVPTISMEPEREGDIRRGAEVARQYLESVGAKAEIVETPGNPVVFGRIDSGASYPTVTV